MTKIVGSGGGDAWWPAGRSVGAVWTLSSDGLLEINWEEQIFLQSVRAVCTGAPHALGLQYASAASGDAQHALLHFTSGLMLETFVEALRTVAAETHPALPPPRAAPEIPTLEALASFMVDPSAATGSECDYINAVTLLQPQLQQTGNSRVEWADDVTLDGAPALCVVCPTSLLFVSPPPHPQVLRHVRLADVSLVRWDPDGVGAAVMVTGAASPRRERPGEMPEATLKVRCGAAARRKSLHSKLFAAYWAVVAKPLPTAVGLCAYSVASPPAEGDEPCPTSLSPASDASPALFLPDSPRPANEEPLCLPPFVDAKPSPAAARAPCPSTGALEASVSERLRAQLEVEIAKKETQYEAALGRVKGLQKRLAEAQHEVGDAGVAIATAQGKFGAKWNCLMALGGVAELNQWIKCEAVERACLANAELAHRLRLITAFTKATRGLALTQRAETAAALDRHLQLVRGAASGPSPLLALAPTGILPEPLLVPVDEFLYPGVPE